MSCDEFMRALVVETAGRRSGNARLNDDVFVEHGRACADCRRLWEADRVLRVSGTGSPSQLGLSMELRTALADHRPIATRTLSAVQRLAIMLAPIAVSLAAALTWFARVDLSNLTASFWLGVVALATLLATLVQLHLQRGAAGFGIPAWLRWVCVLAVWLGFQWFAVTDGLHSAIDPAVHPRRDCFLLGSLVAFGVGAAAFVAARRSVWVGPTSAGALGGCIGGIAAATFLHVHCAASAGLHVQIVHALPLSLAVLIGALLGRRVLAV